VSNKDRENESNLILVSGASGFIGSRVVIKLLATRKHKIRCMTRKPDALHNYFGAASSLLDIVHADVQNYSDLLRVMKGVDIAFYLVHSMEGSSKEWKKFAERDRTAAKNFARAATACGVKRIIYLGGLTCAREPDLSKHMRSRAEVGEILKTSTAEVTIFRAAIILGQGGGSFQMLQYLVERLPIMVCPKWVLTKSQPIAVDDVIEYLVRSIYVNETKKKTFDIGGPQVLTYKDMMKLYSSILGKSLRIIIIPFLTPRLSSYWVDLITPVRASLARPLIDSLKHESIATDDSICNIIPLKLKNFENSIKTALTEQKRKETVKKKEHKSFSLNRQILIISLTVLALIGFSNYLIEQGNKIFEPIWLILIGLWYFGIALSLYFIRNGARLGSMIAGVIGWITLAFWLISNFYTISGNSVITSDPDYPKTIRNLIGTIVSVLVIASAHNVFHKLRILYL
jgi:uncharacterized protein YbjT (DUF2867 family)